MDSLCSINTRQRSVRGVGQTPLFGPPLRCTSDGQRGSAQCCLGTGDFLRPQGGISPSFYSLMGDWVYCLAPEVLLIKGMWTGPKVFLAMPDACGLRPCDWTHLKNGLEPNSLVRWGALSYLPTPPLGQDMTQGQFFKRSLTGLNSEFSFS